MSSSQPAPVERDSRGILDPWLLRQRVQLTRHPASPALAGLVDRFWAVRWDLPPGVVHRQQVLTHPGANISVGNADARPGDRAARPIEARLNGVARSLTTRTLVGQGWTIAAMTRPGGQPSITQPIAGPWLSPKVVTVKSLPKELLDTGAMTSGKASQLTRCRAPAGGPGACR